MLLEEFPPRWWNFFPGGLQAGSGPTRWCQLATQGLFYRESNMFPICEACSVKCVHCGICTMYCLGKRARWLCIIYDRQYVLYYLFPLMWLLLSYPSIPLHALVPPSALAGRWIPRWCWPILLWHHNPLFFRGSCRCKGLKGVGCSDVLFGNHVHNSVLDHFCSSTKESHWLHISHGDGKVKYHKLLICGGGLWYQKGNRGYFL